MAIFASNIITSDSALGSAKIQKSLRFNSSDSSYFLRTPSSNGNRQAWTFSTWVKSTDPANGSYQTIFSTNNSNNYGANGTYLWFYTTGELGLSIGSGTYYLKTTAKFRDPICWYHVVAHIDTTQGTASDRVNLYVNGEQQTDFSNETYPTQNYSTQVNNQTQHTVGARRYSSIDTYFNGYLAETNFIDGQALDASYFGFTDPQTGIWMPKKFTPNKINNGTTWSSNATTSNLSGGNIADVFDGDTYDSATINSTDASDNHFTLSSVNVNASKVTVYVSNSGSDITVYINGSSVGTISSGDMTNNVSIPFSFTFTETIVSTIKVQRGSSTSGWIIYGISLDDVMLIDGNTSNIGVNGFRLDYSDNSSTAALGTDKSNNGNDWTVNNLSVTAGEDNDSLEDTPTNNFCTMNPLMMNGTEVAGTHSDGLLTWKSDNNYATTQATFPVTTGKWYWECEMESQYVSIAGITRGTGAAENTYIGYDTNGNLFGFGYYYNDGTVKGTTDGLGTTSNNNLATSQTTAANGDILGIASDIANGYLIFYKNGTHIYTITGISNAFDWFPSFSSYGTSATWHVNYGQRPFSYTPPVGHKSLCSENLLPDSSIVKPQRNFETLLYTGNDGSQTITGLEFDPDFVWAKNRQDNGYHHDLYDTVRGNNLRIFSSQNQAEATGYLQFGVTGGFSLTSGGGINSNSKNHVAWCWKAGGAAVTNTVGNLPAQVSVNEEAGFSIVSYTGNGSNGQTVGHGLGKKPAWIILKNRDASQNWRVWHKELASDGSKRLLLDAMNASEDAGFLNDTAPTSTIFTLGNADDAWNSNGDKFIAYCWAEIPGYSKFGSYKGNGSTNGTYVHLGFKPAFIITKQTNGTGSWFMFDNKRNGYNETEPYVMSNVANGEATDLGWDFLSHGFKHRNSYSATNGSGNTFVYMAFAEQPGATSFDTFPNAR